MFVPIVVLVPAYCVFQSFQHAVSRESCLHSPLSFFICSWLHSNASSSILASIFQSSSNQQQQLVGEHPFSIFRVVR